MKTCLARRRTRLAATAAIAALALAIGAVGATAQQGQGRGMGAGMGGGMGAGPGAYQRLQQMDTNGDGVLSPDEAAGWQEMAFSAMDGDGDGKLTKTEFMSVSFGPGGGKGMRAASRKGARWADADMNGDGVVTMEEFKTSGAARFTAADFNKDGKVTVQEFWASHAQ
ncbi:EF-hand domain-containing protein [Afifella sp. IM 167]|nr:EF-hand domain-containing protein [Afifella sp. IM 167]